MKLKYSWSQWNNLETKTPYHAKPTQAELKAALKNGGTLRRDINTIFIHKDWPSPAVIVQKTIGNSITSNRYLDCYSILN
jgi:hypothetical protein